MAHDLPYIAAINEAIQPEMERDETVLYSAEHGDDGEPAFVEAFGRTACV